MREESLKTMHVIDMASGAVTRAPPMQVARANHTAAASTSALFVFGGGDLRLTEYSFASCEMFNPKRNQ